jgi:hypothetical protein
MKQRSDALCNHFNPQLPARLRCAQSGHALSPQRVVVGRYNLTGHTFRAKLAARAKLRYGTPADRSGIWVGTRKLVTTQHSVPSGWWE